MKKLNWIIAFFGLVIIASCEKKKSTSHHPNVILIISDQWSTRVSDGSGNYDNGILTPGIDLLAKQELALIKHILLIHYVPLQEQVYSQDFILTTMMLDLILKEILFLIVLN